MASFSSLEFQATTSFTRSVQSCPQALQYGTQDCMSEPPGSFIKLTPSQKNERNK